MFATRSVRFFATALRTEGRFLRTKRATDLAGVEIHPDPLPALESTYTQTLGVLKALPASAVFRQSSEAVTQLRLDTVRAELTPEAKVDPAESEAAITRIVDRINGGIIEEILDQAKDEFQLAAKMVDWKPHDPLQVPAPPGQWSTFNMQQAAGGTA
ncbi:hypothetical protein MSPP1_000964 [Malassezia sp. CBS 17886]|nr:hypothetical protein MSPP1_000964 [Malassezia sp. CBS 17886]